MRTPAYLIVTTVVLCCAVAYAAEPPEFKAETIDDTVGIGYGVAVGDVNGDGKPDIVLADKKQFVWYENPSWQRHVMAENLTERDNVCIAVRDIDGDGKVEIAVGAEWNPGDTERSGAVFYLVPPEVRTQEWTPVKLYNEPVVHRMRWLKVGDGDFRLIVSPLHGRGNRNGKGAGVKLIAYEMPDDPTQPWKTTIIEDTMHVTHNFDPCQWNPETEAEEILYIGQEGAMVISYDGGQWSKKKLPAIPHGGEIRLGSHGESGQFVTTIEPWHGTHLVYYPRDSEAEQPLGEPIVLDDNFNQGHAIATGDLFGNGQHQVVAGWRNRNDDGDVGVKLYWPTNDEASEWDSMFVDKNGMATEDLRLGDLNGDGRLDIIAAGRATHNLRVYWNQK